MYFIRVFDKSFGGENQKRSRGKTLTGKHFGSSCLIFRNLIFRSKSTSHSLLEFDKKVPIPLSVKDMRFFWLILENGRIVNCSFALTAQQKSNL